MHSEYTVAVVGLGYVGLPLSVAFSQHYDVVGYDINAERVEELKHGLDVTREVSEEDLLRSKERLIFSSEPEILANCKTIIVAVPTPVDQSKAPDLSILEAACRTVGKHMSAETIVIFESTVYPGCTEEFCIPILDEESGLILNKDYFVGYSPERMNPGDKLHTVKNIVKVTSASTPLAADWVDDLYAKIVEAGTYRASSIRVAEAAKVIENTQRDLNIALMNELAMIFDRLDLDTSEVIDAAASKWNFIPFRPGLVGGHCIGVDPYYLTHKAENVGYHPEIVLAGRRINDGMGAYIAKRFIKELLRNAHSREMKSVLVAGVTFKENCPDLRNTKVFDIVRELQSYGVSVDVWDPWVRTSTSQKSTNFSMIDGMPQKGRYDGVIIAVGHSIFKEMGADSFRAFCRAPGSVLFDVKSIFAKADCDLRL